MQRYKDLAGLKFGKLTVIEKVKKPDNLKATGAYWLCQCECGRRLTVYGYTLSSSRKQRACKYCAQVEELVGRRFGKLLVIERKENSKAGSVRWLCRCDCGKTSIVQANNLKKGSTQSCGCYKEKRKFLPKGEASINRAYEQYVNRGFSLTKERFLELALEDCFYCGSKPSNVFRSKSNNGDFIYNGIDRINPSKGYVEGNIVTCCWICNQAKRNTSVNDFYIWIKTIYNNLSNKRLII